MKIDNLTSKIVTPKKEDTEFTVNSFASPTDAITSISIDLLVPFESQPFKPYTKEKLEELSEDIKINGVLSPILMFWII